MATETQVQELIHKLEEGGWAKWVTRILLLMAIGFVINLWFFRDAGFKGLAHEKAIEQAQISREIARGHGFSTLMIRPAAVAMFEKNKGGLPEGNIPDIYHAPLHPWMNSWIILLNKASWPMTPKDIQYTLDKLIAGMGLFFFLLSVLVNYFTAKRLFDERLALISMGLMILCQQFWNFALSGLPQMLMLFIFSCAIHTLLRAVEARSRGTSPLWWLIGTGALFGLLALTHGLTIWIFFGALIWVTLVFRPMGRDAGIMLAVFLVVYSPWLIRNYQVCGNPLGMGIHAALVQVEAPTESQIMRTLDGSLDAPFGMVRRKLQEQTLNQFERIYELLGSVLLAPLFFIALMHPFKRPEVAIFRWGILMLWLFAVLGMSCWGLTETSGLFANDLHVLFIPFLTFYGLAFVLVMWSRLEIHLRLAWLSFVTLIYGISTLPFIFQFLELLGQQPLKIAWPPYVPPYIAIMNNWTTDREVIMTDMPWAVAWYADRKSVWLPMAIKDFTELNDYNRLHGPIVGLYLTPVTGNRAFISDIAKGEYKEWAQFIMRNVNARNFPLKYVTALPMESECVFYSDRDRWSTRED